MTTPKTRLGPKYPSVLKPARRGVYQTGIPVLGGGECILYRFWGGRVWGPIAWSPEHAENRHRKEKRLNRTPMSWWRGVLK